jgi:GT2 family glycosyltransferase
MPHDAFVAAIIPSHNSGPFLEKCVQSILAEDRLIDSVIVVDSASVDNAAQEVKRLSSKVDTILLPKDRGISFALNTGIRRAFSKPNVEFLLFMDDDAWVEPGTIRCLVDVLRVRPDIGIISPMQCEYDNDQVDRGFALCLSRSHAVEEIEGLSMPALKLFFCKHLVGATMMIPRRVLETVGLFDENFFLYGNETDLCARVRHWGYAVVAVYGIRAHHRHNVLTPVPSWSRRAMMEKRAEVVLILKDKNRLLKSCIIDVLRLLLQNVRQAIRSRSLRDFRVQLRIGAWLAVRFVPILVRRFKDYRVRSSNSRSGGNRA